MCPSVQYVTAHAQWRFGARVLRAPTPKRMRFNPLHGRIHQFLRTNSISSPQRGSVVNSTRMMISNCCKTSTDKASVNPTKAYANIKIGFYRLLSGQSNRSETTQLKTSLIIAYFRGINLLL